MKILMATMGLDIGGAETHIVELSKALKALGHEVAVVSNGGVYVSEIQAAGIRHYSAPLDQRSLTAMFRARRILKRILRRERPDIVHAHARIPAFLCGTLGGRKRYAFVTSCHGVYQVSGMLKLLSNWGEHALAVSEDIRDYLMEQYGVPEEQIALTINGIDTERFSPAVSGQAVRQELGLGEGPVIGHVSRLDQAASHTARQLISIAPQLCAQVPGLQIVIVGGGDVYEELAVLARQANERIGRAGVVLTGPRTDVERILAACCLFVGVSRAALEAMAAGKPAVLSGAQGHTGLFTPELLDKAVDTNFCCRTDPVSTQDQLLEEVLAALALPPERQAELGAFGRQVVQERYSVGRMARDALSVYDRVRRRRYQVVMSGYYGFGNAGDDAILESIHQSIRSASDEVAVTVLSNDPELTRKQYGLEAVPRFRALRVFRALWKGDVLLSGGGSLLQDATSTRSLVYYLSVIHCARLLHKPVMLYANGIGPVRDPANRRRVRRAVERAALVTLRDHASARELAEMGVERPVQVTADPVFRPAPGAALRGGVRPGLGQCGGLLRPAGGAVRPPAPGTRSGDPLPPHAARPGPGGHRSGPGKDGGALLCAGGALRPPGADGGPGPGQAVSGYAAAYPDLRGPDGGARHGAGLRPQGVQLPGGAGAALRRRCGAVRRRRGHPPGRRPHGGLRRRLGPSEGEVCPAGPGRRGERAAAAGAAGEDEEVERTSCRAGVLPLPIPQ